MVACEARDAVGQCACVTDECGNYCYGRSRLPAGAYHESVLQRQTVAITDSLENRATLYFSDTRTYFTNPQRVYQSCSLEAFVYFSH